MEGLGPVKLMNEQLDKQTSELAASRSHRQQAVVVPCMQHDDGTGRLAAPTVQRACVRLAGVRWIEQDDVCNAHASGPKIRPIPWIHRLRLASDPRVPRPTARTSSSWHRDCGKCCSPDATPSIRPPSPRCGSEESERGRTSTFDGAPNSSSDLAERNTRRTRNIVRVAGDRVAGWTTDDGRAVRSASCDAPSTRPAGLA
ncbi:hypothetical protein FKP32DRAFT_277922 [Trametes sanguinea]|nr:hypothetical protein FKP32DRAFT_277922 [Trametes sanguinea]